MFRITRGINLQHTPAFSPLRFPDGSPLPIYADDEPAEPIASEATEQAPSDGSEKAPSDEAPPPPPS